MMGWKLNCLDNNAHIAFVTNRLAVRVLDASIAATFVICRCAHVGEFPNLVEMSVCVVLCVCRAIFCFVGGEGLPFYVALPSTTIDWDIKNFKDIPIEERNSEELSHIEGLDVNNKLKKVLIYPKKSKSLNLAFDVTPSKYVTGLITEKGVCEASNDSLKKMFR